RGSGPKVRLGQSGDRRRPSRAQQPPSPEARRRALWLGGLSSGQSLLFAGRALAPAPSLPLPHRRLADDHRAAEAGEARRMKVPWRGERILLKDLFARRTPEPAARNEQ